MHCVSTAALSSARVFGLNTAVKGSEVTDLGPWPWSSVSASVSVMSISTSASVSVTLSEGRVK